MPKIVVRGATLRCSQGSSTGSLSVAPRPMTGDDAVMGTVHDHLPITNIPGFGTCGSMANPQVSAATSAAQNVLQRMPCVPVIPGAWSPGAGIATVDDVKILTDDSTCRCNWNGTISITNANSDIQVD